MKDPCDCPLCRRGLRVAVAQIFEAERTWLGAIGIRIFGKIDWVPMDLLKSVLDEMAELGILIKQFDHPKLQRDPVPIYLLSRLTIPADMRKRGVS